MIRSFERKKGKNKVKLKTNAYFNPAEPLTCIFNVAF